MSELKKFFISFFIFSVVFSLLLYFKVNNFVGIAVFCVLFAILIISLINKIFAKKLHCFLSETGSFLGEKITVSVLFFVFIVAIIPTKILMVIFKRDRLRLKKENVDSYWINSEDEKQNWDLPY